MKQLSIFYTLYLTLALCYSVNRIVALPQLHRYFNSLKNNKNFSFLLLFNIVIAFIVKFVSLLSVLFGVALCFSDIPKYKFPFFFTKKQPRFVDDEEENARAFIEEEERRLAEKCYDYTVASWNYNTNINDINQELRLNASLEYSKFAKLSWQNLNRKFKSWPSFKDPDLKRKFKKSTVLGSSVLPEDVLAQVHFSPFLVLGM